MLEYTRAIAGPLATVMAALIVGLLATRTYRRQKAIERRLEWYEDMHKALEEVAMAYWMWTPAPAETAQMGDQPISPELSGLVRQMQALIDRSWMYASDRGFHTIQRANVSLSDLHQRARTEGFTRADIERVVSVIQDAAADLARDMRKQLGMEALTAPIRKLGESMRPRPNER